MKRRTQWFGEDWSVFHEERGYNRDRNVPEQIRGKVSIDPSLRQRLTSLILLKWGNPPVIHISPLLLKCPSTDNYS